MDADPGCSSSEPAVRSFLAHQTPLQPTGCRSLSQHAQCLWSRRPPNPAPRTAASPKSSAIVIVADKHCYRPENSFIAKGQKSSPRSTTLHGFYGLEWACECGHYTCSGSARFNVLSSAPEGSTGGYSRFFARLDWGRAWIFASHAVAKSAASTADRRIIDASDGGNTPGSVEPPGKPTVPGGRGPAQGCGCPGPGQRLPGWQGAWRLDGVSGAVRGRRRAT